MCRNLMNFLKINNAGICSLLRGARQHLENTHNSGYVCAFGSKLNNRWAYHLVIASVVSLLDTPTCFHVLGTSRNDCPKYSKHIFKFAYTFIHSFTHSFLPSFLHSFIHSCIQICILDHLFLTCLISTEGFAKRLSGRRCERLGERLCDRLHAA